MKKWLKILMILVTTATYATALAKEHPDTAEGGEAFEAGNVAKVKQMLVANPELVNKKDTAQFHPDFHPST